MESVFNKEYVEIPTEGPYSAGTSTLFYINLYEFILIYQNL